MEMEHKIVVLGCYNKISKINLIDYKASFLLHVNSRTSTFLLQLRLSLFKKENVDQKHA